MATQTVQMTTTQVRVDQVVEKGLDQIFVGLIKLGLPDQDLIDALQNTDIRQKFIAWTLEV